MRGTVRNLLESFLRFSKIVRRKSRCPINRTYRQPIFQFFFFSLFQAVFPLVTTFLEIFLLVGLSSHLSKLLVVYTEIIQLPSNKHMKGTVICIITGESLRLTWSGRIASIKFVLFCGIFYRKLPFGFDQILVQNFKSDFSSSNLFFSLAEIDFARHFATCTIGNRLSLITFFFFWRMESQTFSFSPYASL